MLKNIDPLIGPDLLYALAAMGHGDEIVIVDANFPAAAIAATTNYGEVLSIGCHAPRAVEAVLSLMPVDRFEPDPVVTMQVVGDPDAVPEVVRDAMPALEAEGVLMAAVERFAFYARAKSVFAVLHTLEARPYGNFIIRKGVIFP